MWSIMTEFPVPQLGSSTESSGLGARESTAGGGSVASSSSTAIHVSMAMLLSKDLGFLSLSPSFY